MSANRLSRFSKLVLPGDLVWLAVFAALVVTAARYPYVDPNYGPAGPFEIVPLIALGVAQILEPKIPAVASRASRIFWIVLKVILGVILLGFTGTLDSDYWPVILLHGFPQTSRCYTRQLAALGQAGYRAVAPAQRGYSPGARPTTVDAYRVAELAADVGALADSLGFDTFDLVGHDWGAVVAWEFAMRYPASVKRLAILNVPHPAVMLRALMRSPAQLRRSWYIFFFQLPHIPELVVQQNDYAFPGSRSRQVASFARRARR